MAGSEFDVVQPSTAAFSSLQFDDESEEDEPIGRKPVNDHPKSSELPRVDKSTSQVPAQSFSTLEFDEESSGDEVKVAAPQPKPAEAPRHRKKAEDDDLTSSFSSMTLAKEPLKYSKGSKAAPEQIVKKEKAPVDASPMKYDDEETDDEQNPEHGHGHASASAVKYDDEETDEEPSPGHRNDTTKPSEQSDRSASTKNTHPTGRRLGEAVVVGRGKEVSVSPVKYDTEESDEEPPARVPIMKKESLRGLKSAHDFNYSDEDIGKGRNRGTDYDDVKAGSKVSNVKQEGKNGGGSSKVAAMCADGYALAHVDENFSSDAHGDFVLDGGYSLPARVYRKLFPHQREGIAWMWKLHAKRMGGILGDDMGLGKTITTIGFLAGLYHSELSQRFLIVVPKSLVEHWRKEFEKWCPSLRTVIYHGPVQQRDYLLKGIQSRGGVCLTTYGMITSSADKLSYLPQSTSSSRMGMEEGSYGQPQAAWDYVILDEGHKIKNPDIALSKKLRSINSRHKIILSGTPVQNNLDEMWALFDYVTDGRLLGFRKNFRKEYENPITRAGEKDASLSDKRFGAEIAQSLRALIQPHFLRREKSIVFAGGKANPASALHDSASSSSSSGPSTSSGASAQQGLPRKNDFIVYTMMSPFQVQIYRQYLISDDVRRVLQKKEHAQALTALTALKKICDHPRLMYKDPSVREKKKTNGSGDDDDYDEPTATVLNIPYSEDPQELMEQSGKLSFLGALVDNLVDTGHRLLIFSQSRRMLDVIELIIRSKNLLFLRIDGSVNKVEERQKRIDVFNTQDAYACFLLTTQTGGLGFTLTGADRVIVFDPSWNPSSDNQAVDRVYRIGQKRNVVIYRFITCNTIEEKIYRKQVFKGALSKTATEKDNQYRYFTQQQLRDLFKIDDPNSSPTQLQLAELHAAQRISDPELDEHIAFVHSHPSVFGISDHNLLFTKEDEAVGVDPGDKDKVELAKSRLYNAAPVTQPISRAALEAKANKEAALLAQPLKPVWRGGTYQSSLHTSQHASAAAASSRLASGRNSREAIDLSDLSLGMSYIDLDTNENTAPNC
eukprot:CAMPEP_0184645804 /NCGR_PEP_ID=MMETSP0308-20130426/2400_1 /TAXON_ID=38269 /ORGANISM="Gloeochaete witrockiana, Strain SAG 46.84" /LENGTH=1061 /DNA_ID=CAMNT_0027075225 /DNA_START=95 /DNA_END=3280 /DNA_ORIENTATION=+